MGCADEMAFVYSLAAAATDKHILVVVGHAGHLVGHHLANGNDQVMTA